MDTVTVKYVGPGSDTDKRELKVTPAEAKRLTRKGLWQEKKKRQTVKKSGPNG